MHLLLLLLTACADKSTAGDSVTTDVIDDTSSSTDDTGPTDDSGTTTDDSGTTTDDSGTTTDDSGTTTDDTAPRSCGEIEAEFIAETEAIRACTEASECGQPLVGTSCGCTRDWVARTDADTTTFYELLAEAVALGCDIGGDSTCDCPPTDGYACIDNTCTWDYDVAADPVFDVCETTDGEVFTFGGAYLDGDELVVTVSYGGGCADHDFTLCWPDQTFLESSPVQADLELLHQTPGDPCDAWITEEPRFDLTPLADAWHTAYGSGSGTIIVNIGSESLEWSF